MIDSVSHYYNPSDNATRGYAAMLPVADYEIISPLVPTFDDVSKTHEYYEYIEIAYANGIVSGYSSKPGYFGPDDFLTREQFAKIIVEAFNRGLTWGVKNFSDVTSDMWSYLYVENVAYKWIINGHPDGTFHPFDNINRADVAVVAWQAYERANAPLDYDDDSDNDSDASVSYLEPSCAIKYNVVDEIYTGFNCDDTIYDLTGNSDFMDLLH